MKLALLTTEYPPHWGGLGASVYHTARELARRGHDVHVLAPPRAGAHELPGVTLHRVPLAPVPAYYAVSFAKRAVRAAIALDVDLVHVASPCVLPTEKEWDLLDRAGVASAVTFHGSWLGEREAVAVPGASLTWNDVGVRALGPFLEPLERVALRRAKALLTVSGFAKRELARYDADAAERVAVVPNGVDASAFAPGAPPRTGRVLAVGRLSGRKNFETLVRAAALLRGRVTALVIVGRDGGLASRLAREARRSGVPLALLASASQGELARELARADVFALPTRYEAQGIAFLEAMACAIPCVGGDVGGVPEVVVDGETGALVAPDDADALARAIAGYLDDPGLARAHGAAGRRRVEERFDWPVLAARVETVLAEAVA